ncbi:MAG: flagellar assembly protein FliX [Magnetospirillum sp.]|nr:flagellar assembly protein FliX [Magnetospirillum sp.]
MKVSGVGSGASASGARRADKTKGKAEFKEALADAIDPPETHGVDSAPAIGAVDALLIIQSVGDATERESRRRLVQRGEAILDRLEEIRHGLLLGTVPKEKLVELAQMVRARRTNCADPRLAGLLDEIELRAEVELAKLSRGL